MKRIIFSLALAFLLSSSAVAHEEPAKTLKEKKEKEEKAAFYQSKNVASYTVWKHEIVDNKPDMERKEKFLTTQLDEHGNIAEMLVYKNTDTLEYRVAFRYDKHNNMTGDTDFNPDGAVNENIEYKYDSKGRVTEQMNYGEKHVFDSRFTYSIDEKSRSLTFTKYKPADSVEYQIIYRYDGPVDESNNTEIIKQKPTGELIMRVENRFDVSNLRMQKRIYDENDLLLYYFEYKYFEGTNRFSEIIKKSPEDMVLTTTGYSLNEMGLVSEVTTLDAEGNLMSYSSYTYNFRNRSY